jgi:hypothetical protein
MTHPCPALWKLIEKDSRLPTFASTILRQGWLTNGMIAVKLTKDEMSFFKKELKRYKDNGALNISSVIPDEVKYCLTFVMDHPDKQPELVELHGGGKTVFIQKQYYDILKKRSPKGEFFLTSNDGIIAYSERTTIAVVSRHTVDKTT